MHLILIVFAALALSGCASRETAYFGKISQSVGAVVGR